VKLQSVITALKYSILVIGMILILIPMYLTVTIALKSPAELAQSFFSLPAALNLDNFKEVIHKAGFWKYLFNSIMITVLSVSIMITVIPMVSYAVSRNESKRYYKVVYFLLLAGIFVPFQAIMLPTFKHLSDLHLLNHSGLLLLYVSFSLGQGVFMGVGFLKSVPLELDEAAKIDGCGVWLTFIRIIYPLMLPVLVTMLIINSLWVWNDFQLPLIVLNKSSDYWTLPLFIYNFKSTYTFNVNLAFAGFLLTMLPIIALYAFVQRYIIGGLTQGAIK